jgi:hypothetical protein
MSMHWSRREFLATAAAPLITIDARGAPPVFDERERRDLEAAMDEIIPAGDGMPAASEMGGVAYLERVAAADANVANELRAALAALEKASGGAFGRLDHEARVSALRKLEAGEATRFAQLRDYVYESYYTQPRVWKLIGYEFYPTDHAGPHMAPFDESILDDVRKMPKLYREA